MRQRLHRLLATTLLVCAAASAYAEPVTLAFSSASTARHEYFVDDPVVAAEVQITGTSGNWSLQRGVRQRLVLADVYLSTGPAVAACCQSEVHDFVFGLTVGGVTRQVTAGVRMSEIANDQYQFDMLDRPEIVFDLGSLGLLTVDVWAYAFQLLANNPFYNASYVQADVVLRERTQAVPLPATLALASLGLVLIGVQRTQRRA